MDYDTWYQDEEDCIMGVDVAFGGSSNTAITICRIKRPPPKDDIIAVQNYEPVIEVILSEVYSKPDFNQIVGRILWLMDKAVCRWCLIDASAPEVLRALCLQTNQRLDWLDELKEWEDKGINVLHPHTRRLFQW